MPEAIVPTKTATFVKNLTGWTGKARLYRLDPPLDLHHDWDDHEKTTGATEYVIVSATVAMYSGPETYIFSADADSEVTDWGELHGSYRGGLDHEAALRGAGYEVAS